MNPNPNNLRILVLAPGSNPNSVTGQLIGYSHGEALARLHRVTFVIETRDEDAVRKANGGFYGIESISLSGLDRIYDWAFRRIFKGDRGNLLWTAVRFPRAIAFEWHAWRRLRSRIFRKEFDVVLRLLPIAPMFPSPFAFFLRNGPIPFVLGPLNGGVPWPKGFSQLERQRRAAGHWAANLRNLYRFLPYARSTYTKATAIIAGSSHTCREFARFAEKLFYVPGENGVSSSLIAAGPVSRSSSTDRLELIFVGRLVPYKSCDIAVKGAASLLRRGLGHLSILGDGPDRQKLEKLADELGVRGAITFFGMLSHAEVLSQFSRSDVLVFPSLREFGGGVVFEALAMGVAPVVADHGGPGDIVTEEIGYKIPVTNEIEMVARIDSVLQLLASHREHLETLRWRGLAYARKHLTWEAKAGMVGEILLWAARGGMKPSMPAPRFESHVRGGRPE